MYIPKNNEETDVSVIHSLLKSHPLGTWVTKIDGELNANHIPFLLDPDRGEHGTLIGHVARANPVWKSFSTTENSIIIFQGAETYISPSWYPSKHEHGRALPTWNYAVVHIHGIPHYIEDQDWLLNHLNVLTNEHESGQPLPWKVSDAPKDFTQNMLDGIVGIEIPIKKIVGKWKVNQNKQDTDKRGVVSNLLARQDSQSSEMASYVNRFVLSE